MFENDRWDAQLAADYNGKYVEVTDAVGGLSQYGDPIPGSRPRSLTG
jgi:hypothetical protein